MQSWMPEVVRLVTALNVMKVNVPPRRMTPFGVLHALDRSRDGRAVDQEPCISADAGHFGAKGEGDHRPERGEQEDRVLHRGGEGQREGVARAADDLDTVARREAGLERLGVKAAERRISGLPVPIGPER